MSRVYTRKFDWDEARRLRGEGWTHQRIADRFGVSRTAIHFVLNEKARLAANRRAKEWQMGGSCEECGGRCIRPSHLSRSEHAAADRRMLCRTCRGRASRTGVEVINGVIQIRCGSCRIYKPVDDYGPRTARRLVEGKAVRKRTCRSCEALKRQDYRERHKVPCRSCGAPCLPANEKGRHGKDTGLCRTCWATSKRNPLRSREKQAA